MSKNLTGAPPRASLVSSRRRSLVLAPLAAAALGAARRSLAQGAAPLRVGFVYVSPIGEAGWSLSARPRAARDAAGARRQGDDALRRIRARGRRRRARHARPRRAGRAPIFATSFGYLEPALRVAADFPEHDLRALRRLQERAQPRHLQRALLRGPLPRRAGGGQHDAQRHRRLRRRLSGARGDPGHQCLRARHARGEPEGAGAACSGSTPGSIRRASATRHWRLPGRAPTC